MFQTGILSASCLSFFSAIDVLIAAAIQATRCPLCGGPLRAGSYQRKPRGHVEPLDGSTTLRLSLSCGRDGCRHRVTPPSVLFWGGLVYSGPAVLALLCTPPNSAEEEQLRHDMGCSRQSICRWRDRFGGLWQTATGRMVAGTITLGNDERSQPRAVLTLWRGRWPYRITRWMMLIHPLTGGRNWEHDGQKHGPLDAQKMGFAHHLESLQIPGPTP
jgi:hypothetical protein